MTEKELKKLNRAELLEMLVTEMKEVERLEGTIATLQQQLADKAVIIDNAGSIAEAALQLNGVFRAAQKAADQYLKNIYMRESDKQKIETAAQAKAERIIAEAEEKASEIENQAKENASRYWTEAMRMMDCFYRDHPDLKETLDMDMKVKEYAESAQVRAIGSESD